MAKQEGLAARVYMLAGDEDALRRRRLGELVALSGLTPQDSDYELMEGGNPAEWVASASTFPFFADRRVVVVRNLLRVDSELGKQAGLGTLPDSSLLILVADEEGSDDTRKQKQTANRKGWEKIVTAAGGKVELFEPGKGTIVPQLREEATRLGKTMNPAVATELAEMVGKNFSRGIEELQKVALFIGDEKTIQVRDLQAVVMTSKEWNVFNMIDAIANKNPAAALGQLRTMITNTSKAEDAAFQSILPLLSRSYRLLWQARACVEAKMEPEQAAREGMPFMMEKPSLAAEFESRRRSMLANARKLSFQEISRGLDHIAVTDATLKGLYPGFSGIETLEQLVLKLAMN